MSKNSFEQPIKREKPPIKEMEEKLDKAEKMVEEVEKRLKTEEVEKKIEEHIEKPVKELKRLWEENEGKIKRRYEIFSFFSSLSLPEVPSSLLERISNKFLKEFDWEKFKGRKHLDKDLGLFLSAFLKKNVENYILSQKRKGLKEDQIKPIEVYLKVRRAPIILSMLGCQNHAKLHLIIEGDSRDFTGTKMQDGEIVVKGDCGNWIGEEMQGGKIIIEGSCEYGIGEGMQGGKIIVERNCGDDTGIGMQNGEIVVKGDCGNWIGEEMQGGKIIIEGSCGGCAGKYMQGGELNIKGEVESFDKSAFSSNNQGTIIWKRTKIWENGNWTKEGKEMKEKGEIPV